jgi:cytochrome c556
MRIALTTAALFATLTGCRASDAGEASNASAVTASTASAGAVVTPAVPAAPISKADAARVMHERHEGMEQIGKATKTAGRALKSPTPDVAIVQASAATIARLAQQTGRWFPPGTGPDVGKTGATPAIWQKPADFAAKTRAFEQSAAAFNAAAQSGDTARIQSSFGSLGKSCKACHESYRSEMHH